MGWLANLISGRSGNTNTAATNNSNATAKKASNTTSRATIGSVVQKWLSGNTNKASNTTSGATTTGSRVLGGTANKTNSNSVTYVTNSDGTKTMYKNGVNTGIKFRADGTEILSASEYNRARTPLDKSPSYTDYVNSGYYGTYNGGNYVGSTMPTVPTFTLGDSNKFIPTGTTTLGLFGTVTKEKDSSTGTTGATDTTEQVTSDVLKDTTNKDSKTNNGLANSLTESEFNKSTDMQDTYGNYQNYLNGITVAQQQAKKAGISKTYGNDYYNNDDNTLALGAIPTAAQQAYIDTHGFPALETDPTGYSYYVFPTKDNSTKDNSTKDNSKQVYPDNHNRYHAQQELSGAYGQNADGTNKSYAQYVSEVLTDPSKSILSSDGKYNTTYINNIVNGAKEDGSPRDLASDSTYLKIQESNPNYVASNMPTGLDIGSRGGNVVKLSNEAQTLLDSLTNTETIPDNGNGGGSGGGGTGGGGSAVADTNDYLYSMPEVGNYAMQSILNKLIPSGYDYNYDKRFASRLADLNASETAFKNSAIPTIANAYQDQSANSLANLIAALRANRASGLTSGASRGAQAASDVQSVQSANQENASNLNTLINDNLASYLATLATKRASAGDDTATELGAYYSPMASALSNILGYYNYGSAAAQVNNGGLQRAQSYLV